MEFSILVGKITRAPRPSQLDYMHEGLQVFNAGSADPCAANSSFVDEMGHGTCQTRRCMPVLSSRLAKDRKPFYRGPQNRNKNESIHCNPLQRRKWKCWILITAVALRAVLS